MWIQNLGFLEGGRAEKVQVLGRYKYSDIPLKGSFFSVFFIYFPGFAIDRSKKYIKIIENDMKIDAVDPWATADNPPTPLGRNGQVYGTLQPAKPRQIVRCLRMLTHARSYLNPLNPSGGNLTQRRRAAAA